MPIRRVVVVAYPDVQSLDVVGPAEVFGTTNRETGTTHYRIELVAATAEPVRTNSGLSLGVDGAIGSVRGAVDTLVVAAGTAPWAPSAIGS